jgi:hypothetical protein
VRAAYATFLWKGVGDRKRAEEAFAASREVRPGIGSEH